MRNRTQTVDTIAYDLLRGNVFKANTRMWSIDDVEELIQTESLDEVDAAYTVAERVINGRSH